MFLLMEHLDMKDRAIVYDIRPNGQTESFHAKNDIEDTIKFSSLQNLYAKKWNKEWMKVIEESNLEKFWKHQNDVLEKIYKENRNTAPCEPCRFRTLTDFLLYYQDFIFSSKQMVDLLERFDEVQNPKRRARDFKYKYGIEYLTKGRLKEEVRKIMRN